ncbi:MAG: hypothetical protein WB462_05885 [Solirubrobacterales bacterium]
MASPTAEKNLGDRVKALEEELAKLRRAMASLLERVGNGKSDPDLIDELADRPMSEEEMEAAFARLDAEADRTR